MIPGLGRSPGKGKGYPLQYSGLENSIDCIVHGVSKNRTQLSDFHFVGLKVLSEGMSTRHSTCESLFTPLPQSPPASPRGVPLILPSGWQCPGGFLSLTGMCLISSEHWSGKKNIEMCLTAADILQATLCQL